MDVCVQTEVTSQAGGETLKVLHQSHDPNPVGWGATLPDSARVKDMGL